MKKFFFLLGIVVTLVLFGVSQALAVESAGKGAKVSDILQTPEQVEQFMRLDNIASFSHEGMFLDDQEFSDPGRLKLREAVDLGLKNNLVSRTAKEKVAEALGRRWQMLSGLLPHVEGSISQGRTFKENLEAIGFRGQGAIGPFNTFDARIQLTQEVLNLSVASNFQAGIRDVNAARYEKEFARQKVTLLVSIDYVNALRAQGDFKAAESNWQLSQKLLKRAQDQFEAGVANSVDVARARTRLAQDEFRLAQTRTSVHDAYLDLQRSTGLPYNGVVTLMNTLGFIREQVPDLAVALKTAEEKRLDLRVSKERVQAAQYRVSGARTQLFPKIEFLGDIGSSANEIHENDRTTSSIMLRASMPIFEGGKILGEIKEAKSLKTQIELYVEDLKRQVEEDVQKALWLLDTGIGQVDAASHVVGLAEHELTLASDRFTQGIGDNIEVVNAQTALAEARSQYVTSLMQYHTARINFYFALGETESFYLQDVQQKKEQ